jgi:hypothetical protein
LSCFGRNAALEDSFLTSLPNERYTHDETNRAMQVLTGVGHA